MSDPLAALRAEGQRRIDTRVDNPNTHDGSPYGSHVLGLIAEQRFAERYGFEVDLEPRPGGDGGKDFIVAGVGFVFRVNVQGRVWRRVLDICLPEGKQGRSDIHVLLALLPDEEYRVIDSWWCFEPAILEHCPTPRPPLKEGMASNHMLPVGLAHKLIDSPMDRWLLSATQVVEDE